MHDKLKIKRRAHKIQTFICLFLLGKAQSEDSLTVKEEERDGGREKKMGILIQEPIPDGVVIS